LRAGLLLCEKRHAALEFHPGCCDIHTHAVSDDARLGCASWTKRCSRSPRQFAARRTKTEYAALVAAADVTGHYAVGVLLESCLADKLAFVERTRRLIRNFVAAKVAAKVAAA
jgi:hypothetical protein